MNPDEVNCAFLPIAEAVEDFATTHALAIDRCPRGNAGWELTAGHDRGGKLSLLLLYDETLGLGVGSVWQFQCIEMAILYSHFRSVRPCALDAGAVTTALGSELTALRQVPFGYWTHLQPLQIPGTSDEPNETSSAE